MYACLICRASAIRARGASAKRGGGGGPRARVTKRKDDFRKEKMRACMRVYVCTEDGGAGRKRGGDSVCEKRKKNTNIACETT